jgi:hypothetical protein
MYIKIIFFSLALMVFCSSCRKSGCQDERATNFVPKAKKDDGSCTYQCNVLFWWKQQYADELINNGTSMLTMVLYEQAYGSAEPTAYYNSLPVCGEQNNQGISVIINMGRNPTSIVDYEIVNQDGDVLFSDVLLLNKNCLMVQLL